MAKQEGIAGIFVLLILALAIAGGAYYLKAYEGKFCGGFAGNLPENQCPFGYTCRPDSPKGNDTGGKCESILSPDFYNSRLSPVSSTKPQPRSAPNSTDIKFEKEKILYLRSFIAGGGNGKKFVVLDTGNDERRSAGAYITDTQLSTDSAIRIDRISDPEIDWDYAGDLDVFISPYPGTKYLLIIVLVGDRRTTVIVDENGKVISDKVAENAVASVTECKRGQCGFEFDGWGGGSSFYAKITTAPGPIYQILMDLKTGKDLSAPKEI